MILRRVAQQYPNMTRILLFCWRNFLLSCSCIRSLLWDMRPWVTGPIVRAKTIMAYFMFKKRNIEEPAQCAVFSPFFPMPCSPIADERGRGFILFTYSSI